MALAYTAPTWENGGGVGISASQLQALSDCMEGLVQGSDKAITNIAINGQTITLTFADGSQETATASGLKGISSIAKTGTSGLVDTYTITFTDGSTTTFTVTNGAQGEAGPQGPQGPQGIQGPAGDDGVSPEVTITAITGGHRVNITDATHPQGQDFDVMDGHDGASDWADITNKPNFATVATSGSYNDLSNKPSIPAAQVNSDWNAASGVAQILNKPTIPSITNCYQTTDTEKTALANADYVPFYAISASAKRKISWSNIKSVLKSYFDTLYSKVVANPSGTATGTLTKLGIGSDIYDIQGGGSSTLAGLSDVDITSPSDGQILQYDATSQKWVNEVVGKIPVGAVATPTDDIQTWLHCAAIWNKNYTLLSEVLADSTTLLALISMPNAVDYMVRSTTWASAVTANSTAMSYIGANNYCADTLLTDNTWLTEICNSAYFESVLNVKVPTMTGYTTPYGQAFATTENSVRKAWQAFMQQDAEGWASADYQTTNQGIGYKFTQPVNVKYFLLQNPKNTMKSAPYTFNLEYSDDGTNWTKVGETYTNPKIENTDYGYMNYYVSFANNTKHLYWRIYVLTVRNNPTATMVFTGMIQFYGRA